MSKIVGYDKWAERITRIYVWYGDEPTDQSLPDWQHDPVIAELLDEVNPGRAYVFSAARYYWNPEPTGQVVVITRLAP